MYKYGLIGYPLSHSFSPGYFKEKFEAQKISDCRYDLYPLEKIEDFLGLLKDKNLKGINVTIPYKEQVIPFLDQVEGSAKEIGAVNTIKIEGGKTTGYNTDIWGFEQSLKPLVKDHHKKALIFGTGGASKAVKFVLDKLEISNKFVSRKKQGDCFIYDDINAEILNTHQVLINTTPLGLHPNIDKAPAIPYQHLSDVHLLYDLVYNPEVTKFMGLGKKQGAIVKNGYEMLCLQADRSWEIWEG